MAEPTPVYIKLNEDEFRALVAGRAADITVRHATLGDLTARIILADIGIDKMIDAVADAIAAATKDMPRADLIEFLRRHLAK